MCAQHQLLGVHAGGKLLVLWHFANKGIDSSYESRSTFFSLLPGGKEKKIYFQSVHFWFFRNRLVSSRFSQGAVARGQRKESIFRVLIFFFENRLVSSGFFQGAPKKTTFLEPTGKTSSTRPTFCFSLTPSSKGEVDLKIDKTFSKITFL